MRTDASVGSARYGFGAMNLMVAVAMIGLGAAVATPQFCSMSEDARKTKGKQDCDTIAQAIVKYHALEGESVKDILDLKAKYVTNIDTLRDPWGNRYGFNAAFNVVYSKGPDGEAATVAGLYDPFAAANVDNPTVVGLGAVRLERAGFERIASASPGVGGMRFRTCLRLVFASPVQVTAPTLALGGSASRENEPSTVASPFRWLRMDGRTTIGDADSPLAPDDEVFRACDLDALHANASGLEPGTFTHGRSYRELLFALRSEVSTPRVSTPRVSPTAPTASTANLGLCLRPDPGRRRILSAIGLPVLGRRRPPSTARLGGGLVVTVPMFRDLLEGELYRESVRSHPRGVTSTIVDDAVPLETAVAESATTVGL